MCICFCDHQRPVRASVLHKLDKLEFQSMSQRQQLQQQQVLFSAFSSSSTLPPPPLPLLLLSLSLVAIFKRILRTDTQLGRLRSTLLAVVLVGSRKKPSDDDCVGQARVECVAKPERDGEGSGVKFSPPPLWPRVALITCACVCVCVCVRASDKETHDF